MSWLRAFSLGVASLVAAACTTSGASPADGAAGLPPGCGGTGGLGGAAMTDGGAAGGLHDGGAGAGDGGTAPIAPCPTGLPAQDRWEPMSFAGAPAARALHTAVWTGSELVIWGGRGPGGALGDGARWSPATDRWTAMQSDASAPSGRWDHVGLWTGSELVVWGGRNAASEGLLDDGARWDPRTDRWRTMLSSPDQPTARTRPAFAWTGSELVVFGGLGAGVDGTADGARWSPATEQWRAMSRAGAPPGGAGRAVPIGAAEVLVATSQAARWDARTDQWRPVGPGFPAMASGYSMVWTGSEALLWGGLQGGRASGAGVRYDPASDRWSAFLASGAPSGRTEQATAWTGSDLVVWGGTAGDTFMDATGLGDGGMWSPSDAWRTLSTTGAPTARWGHSAVWTGSELVVWGGVGESAERGARWR